MKHSRRSFLKLAGTAAADALRAHYGREAPTISTICAFGCAINCHVQNGVIINAEGDPDHPINEGSLCSKGSSLYNVSYIYDAKGRPKPNPYRLTRPLYRAPGSDKWEEKSWEWMLETIARRIKDTRDQYFETRDASGVTVNRTNAIAWLGSAFCTNEENYLYNKIARAIGIVNIDHCARL